MIEGDVLWVAFDSDGRIPRPFFAPPTYSRAQAMPIAECTYSRENLVTCCVCPVYLDK